MQATLVDAFDHHSLDGGSSPPASTRQPNTKFLSTKSLGYVIAGAFAVLRSKVVLSRDFAAIDTCGRTSWSQPDIAPQYSLFGRLFSEFSGLGQVRPQLFLSTSL